LRLAQVKDGDETLVDLNGPQVSYEAVWERVKQEEKRQAEAEEAKKLKVFEQCRCDGDAKCLRPVGEEWLRLPEEEKQTMLPDECLCEQEASRPIEFEADFSIDNNSERKAVVKIQH